MFLSAVVPLTAAVSVERPAYMGRACYAFFLRQVARHDKELAAELHMSQGLKCFTVSELMDDGGWRRRRRIDEGESLWMRFTSLDGRLSELLQEEVLPALPEKVELGPLKCRMGKALTEKAEHRWAGTADAGKLKERWFAEEEIPAKVTFLFGSPTLSRRIRRDWVWPVPAVVYGSLLQRWNRYAESPFDEGLVRLVEADVFAARYRLRTEQVRVGSGRFSGWLGRVSYRIFAGEAGFRAALQTLADFALYSGVGYKTTQGMGQVHVVR